MKTFIKTKSIIMAIIITSGIASGLQSKIELDDNIQYLNKEIISFARKNKGKKVGRGECWDLAAIPLKKYNASWNGQYIFGKKISYGNNKRHYIGKDIRIKIGDIIQYKKVKLEGSWGYMTLGYPDHTAIINKVETNLKFSVLEQNFNNKRYVTENMVDLNYLKKGSYIIYRPFRKK
ncbi:MAG: hypothetical protein OEZ22_13155 [Spirochaetia bacterium]|nr:hypothetical protein [Spirochaetia bacterium]